MNKSERREDFTPERKLLPEDHPDVRLGRIGVLLVNLGTPDATDYWSMRRYLKEFLSDKRVIEVNRVLWWFILNVMVLTKRPTSSGEAYKLIWNKERDESPLKTVSRAQSKKLAKALAGHEAIVVDWGMRYGNPSTKSRIEALHAQGCDRILLFPLYPQYAAATMATACDKAFEALSEMRWQPALRTVPPYHDLPVYIDALAESLEQFLGTLDWQPDVILASFHGLPEDYLEKGDPYHCQCVKTARLLEARLRWDDTKFCMSFQSRFGKAEWLKPYTDKTVEALAQSGVKNMAVITPGFSTDCVETLEEIALLNGDIFKRNGGKNFAAIPCLNDSEGGMRVIEDVVRRELQGWI